MTARRTARRTRAGVVLAGLSLLLGACGSTRAGPPSEVSMARVDDPTQWFQAEVHRQLLIELGYQVPPPETMSPNTFYPKLASGEYDLWADGWFPNHEPYLTAQDVTGGTYETDITRLERDSELQIVQGYMADKATADQLGITSVSNLADPAVAAAFDRDGDADADLVGCNLGWGCNLTTEEQLATFDWGEHVNHVVGDYFTLFEDVVAAHEQGESVLFYNWMPNWTVEVLVPGEDVVWLQAPALPDHDNTTVTGLASCAADPCDLGFPVNDVVSVANAGFIEEHPDVRALLERVDVPAEAVSAQNVDMWLARDYTAVDLEAAAQAWIADNRGAVDDWLDAARAA